MSKRLFYLTWTVGTRQDTAAICRGYYIGVGDSLATASQDLAKLLDEIGIYHELTNSSYQVNIASERNNPYTQAYNNCPDPYSNHDCDQRVFALWPVV